MALLSIDEIKSSDDQKTIDVPCPEWGGDVRLRTLSGNERDELEFWSTRKKDRDSRGFRARLISMAAVDESGNPLFNGEAAKLLGSKSAVVIERLFTAAMKLAGLNDDDVEKLEKKSDEAPDSGFD